MLFDIANAFYMCDFQYCQKKYVNQQIVYSAELEPHDRKTC